MVFEKFKKMSKQEIIRLVCSIPKTIYFNFHYFPFKIAIKFPVIISAKTKLSCMGGEVALRGNAVFPGMVRIGFGYVGIFDYDVSRTIWENKGKVVFLGRANIGHGCKLSCAETGVITFGKNFECTAESQFICADRISFGNDCLVSWQNLFMDTDFHHITHRNKEKINHLPITFGDNVWVGCRCTILKGVNIADNSVVAAGSLVKKSFQGTNLLIAGETAGEIATDICWHL